MPDEEVAEDNADVDEDAEEDDGDDDFEGGENESEDEGADTAESNIAAQVGNAQAPAGYVIISECPPLESNVDMNKLIGKTVLVGCGILTLRGAGSWAECILMLPTWGSETGLIAQLRRMW